MPSLPLDLERTIFEFAALQDTDHNNRVRIILVAKRVYEWVRPIMYRIAIAETTLTIRNWRNAQRTDVARFVRHLLTLVWEETEVVKLLSTFRNVESLAIWGYVPISTKVLKEMNDLPLHTLSVDLASVDLDDAIKNCNAFRNLTHLEILGSKGPYWKDCNALVELPKLTHISFYSLTYVEDEVVLNLLECCSSIRVLIYLVAAAALDTDDDLKIPIKSGDPRYLVFQDDLQEDVKEWERSANGQIGLWELADIIVEARKDKFFYDNSSLIFSRETWMNGLNDDGVRWYKEWSRECSSVKDEDE